MNKLKAKKGDVAIILAVIVLSLVLTVGIAMTEWIVIGFKLSKTNFISAPAYYAAESGIEKTLYKVVAQCAACPKEHPSATSYPLTDSNDYLTDSFIDSSYNVWILGTNPFQAKSIGISRDLKRSIEVNWEKSW